MQEPNTSPTTLYEGWENYHRQLVTAVAALTPEQLAFQPAPHLRPLWMIAAHIISARVWWFHNILGEGSPDIAPLNTWDDEAQPPRTAQELAAALEHSWQMIRSCLDRWAPSDLDQVLEIHWRPTKPSYSRQWVIWHLIEHDLHHGGEISLAIGLQGQEGMDI